MHWCFFPTNKDPKLIGVYYVEAIEKYLGCTKVIRANAETKNETVQAMQESLMGNGRNGYDKRYIVGCSILNQTLEWFWGHLHKQCLEFWMCLYHYLKKNAHFIGNLIDKKLLHICVCVKCSLYYGLISEWAWHSP